MSGEHVGTSGVTERERAASSSWHGIHAVMVTPFNADMTVDYVALQALVDFLGESPVSAVICLGSEGEFYALSDSERLRVAEATADALEGRRRLVIGVSHPSGLRSAAFAAHAAELNADAVLSTPPFFGEPELQAIVDHFQLIAGAGVPVFIYNSPLRQGYGLGAEAVKTILAMPAIIGVKQASANILDLVDLIEETADLVLGGSESTIWPALCVGAHGNTATAASVVPEVFSRLWEAHRADNLPAGLHLYQRLAPLRAAYETAGGQAAVVKRLMHIAGLPGGPVRPPARQADETVDKLLLELVAGLKEDGLWSY